MHLSPSVVFRKALPSISGVVKVDSSGRCLSLNEGAKTPAVDTGQFEAVQPQQSLCNQEKKEEKRKLTSKIQGSLCNRQPAASESPHRRQ